MRKRAFVLSAEALLSLTVALLAVSAILVFEDANRGKYRLLRGGMMANDVAEALYASGSLGDEMKMYENAAWLADSIGACIAVDDKMFGECTGRSEVFAASRIVYSGGGFKRVGVKIIY